MRVFYSLEDLPKFNNAVFTQGTFDGVHLGHQKLLKTLENEKDRLKGESILMTFWPHPRLMLYPDDNQLKLLQTLPEKLKILEQCGVDNVIVIKFDNHFGNMTAEDFVLKVLIQKLNIKTAIFGYDHRFGKGRLGDIKLLEAYSIIHDFNVIQIRAEDIDDVTISSSKIRQALLNGEILLANQYLGRNYSFSGTVIKGMQIGRTIGFATANIELDEPIKLLPLNGVYVVKSTIKGVFYNGMLNIGDNPSIKDKGFSVEVHFFEMSEDIYGQNVEILLIDRLRDEKKFSSLEELSLNLQLDKKNALDKIQKH
ncbi:MAG: bifunctional riboflavin kinase/FAD synthetase [Bacteroidota bacterium]|nr:bifunctional riboflavin kinase/FAD synthetase [Bacteroidota bacterium]